MPSAVAIPRGAHGAMATTHVTHFRNGKGPPGVRSQQQPRPDLRGLRSPHPSIKKPRQARVRAPRPKLLSIDIRSLAHTLTKDTQLFEPIAKLAEPRPNYDTLLGNCHVETAEASLQGADPRGQQLQSGARPLDRKFGVAADQLEKHGRRGRAQGASLRKALVFLHPPAV